MKSIIDAARAQSAEARCQGNLELRGRGVPGELLAAIGGYICADREVRRGHLPAAGETRCLFML